MDKLLLEKGQEEILNFAAKILDDLNIFCSEAINSLNDDSLEDLEKAAKKYTDLHAEKSEQLKQKLLELFSIQS